MGKAQQWVESTYPDAEGIRKAELITAFGAGLDAGLAEAEEILLQSVEVLKTT